MKSYKYMHPLKRLKKVRRECRQIIIDTEWWNANREGGPFDCEPERVMLVKVEKAIAAWGTAGFGELASDAVQYAISVRRDEGLP